MRHVSAREEITADEVDGRSRRALEVPLLRFLKASLADRVDGCWSIGLEPSPNVLNAVNALHGGVIATVLDVAAYLAVVPHLSSDEEAITIAFAASYIAPAPPDEQLRASGSLIRRTRGLAFASAELRSDSDLLALANVTKAIRSSPARAPRG
jgi:uncharacterized protein (TIGR00369 family)